MKSTIGKYCGKKVGSKELFSGERDRPTRVCSLGKATTTRQIGVLVGRVTCAAEEMRTALRRGTRGARMPFERHSFLPE